MAGSCSPPAPGEAIGPRCDPRRVRGGHGVDALAALGSGWAYDRVGLRILLIVPFLSALVPMLAFTTSAATAIAGVLVWGVILGVQESTMRPLSPTWFRPGDPRHHHRRCRAGRCAGRIPSPRRQRPTANVTSALRRRTGGVVGP